LIALSSSSVIWIIRLRSVFRASLGGNEELSQDRVNRRTPIIGSDSKVIACSRISFSNSAIGHLGLECSATGKDMKRFFKKDAIRLTRLQTRRNVRTSRRGSYLNIRAKLGYREFLILTALRICSKSSVGRVSSPFLSIVLPEAQAQYEKRI
jgi:hypothetical protein